MAIEQLISRWSGEWCKRIPRFMVDKATALERVRAAVARGEHRSSNGEIPARILDLLDSLALREPPPGP